MVKFILTRKFEDFEECRTWRSSTQAEIHDQRKKLCEEMKAEVVEKKGVEENKVDLAKEEETSLSGQ